MLDRSAGPITTCEAARPATSAASWSSSRCLTPMVAVVVVVAAFVVAAFVAVAWQTCVVAAAWGIAPWGP